MGAWGPGIKDNDRALDFAINVVRESYEAAECNEDFLLVGDMMISYKYILNEEEFAKMSEVINEEIANINDWTEDCREKRLTILNELLENLKKRRI